MEYLIGDLSLAAKLVLCLLPFALGLLIDSVRKMLREWARFEWLLVRDWKPRREWVLVNGRLLYVEVRRPVDDPAPSTDEESARFLLPAVTQ